MMRKQRGDSSPCLVHDNTYYEDKVGIFWNINTKGFSDEGCMISCHMDIEGDTSARRKVTNNKGETIDMWHVKNVRTRPLVWNSLGTFP